MLVSTSELSRTIGQSHGDRVRLRFHPRFDATSRLPGDIRTATAIARSLAKLPEASGSLAGDVAHHAAMGDDASLAARFSLIAAERCLRLCAPREATELADRGLRHVVSLSREDRARIEVGLLSVAIIADVGNRRTEVLETSMRKALVQAQLDSLRMSESARSTQSNNTVLALGHAAQCLAMNAEVLPFLQRAFILAEEQGVYWLGAVCLLRLATGELQSGRPEQALEHCAKLREVVRRLGEASEGPLGDIIEAIARRELRQTGASLAIDSALDALAALDAQAYLGEAYCLAAESDLNAGDAREAKRRARRALKAAEAVERPTYIVWARALLAQSAFVLGNCDEARRHVSAAMPLLETEPFPSVHARSRIAAADRFCTRDPAQHTQPIEDKP